MLLALLLSAAEPLPVDPEFRALSHSEMDAELRACGAQHFTIRYDDELQRELVELRDAQITDDQLRCVYHATDYTPYFVLWTEPRTSLRYYQIGDQLLRPRLSAQARAYFDAHPELGEPPERENGQGDLDFARSIERFCGPLASGLFAIEYGELTVSSEWLTSGNFLENSEALGCAIYASSLRGLEVGFIGNERLAE